MARALFVGTMLLIVLLALWYTLLLPRKDYLVLHERGFRGRMGLRRFSHLFAELESIHSGDICNCDGKTLSPVFVAEAKKRAAAALTVVPKRKSSFLVHGIKARFLAEDVDYLLETAREKCRR